MTPEEEPVPDRQQPQKDRSPEAAEQGGRQPAEGGEIKDKEAETSNSYGNTRDSGERPG